MFGFKIVNMLLGIKLENQYAPSVPDMSGTGERSGWNSWPPNYTRVKSADPCTV